MAKTAAEIQSDIIALLEGSDLAKGVTGKVYRGTPDSSYRPRGSQKEDIVVIRPDGNPDQIETGEVTVLIYAPDVDVYNDGVLGQSGRTRKIEALAKKWVESLTCDKSNYKFELSGIIGTFAEPEIHQHFVSVKLHYEYYGG